MAVSPSQKRAGERLDVILSALRRGATRGSAASAAGIQRETLWQWISEDPNVSDAVARAEADCRRRVEEKFTEDALDGEDWRARSDWLKRRARDDWGDKLDLTGLPDHILLELLGGNRGVLTAQEYPSAPKALLTRGIVDEDVDASNAIALLSEGVEAQELEE